MSTVTGCPTPRWPSGRMLPHWRAGMLGPCRGSHGRPARRPSGLRPRQGAGCILPARQRSLPRRPSLRHRSRRCGATLQRVELRDRPPAACLRGDPEIHALVAGRGWSDGPSPDLLVQIAAQLALRRGRQAARTRRAGAGAAPAGDPYVAGHDRHGHRRHAGRGDLVPACTRVVDRGTSACPLADDAGSPRCAGSQCRRDPRGSRRGGGEGMGAAYLAFALHNACHADKRHP